MIVNVDNLYDEKRQRRFLFNIKTSKMFAANFNEFKKQNIKCDEDAQPMLRKLGVNEYLTIMKRMH